MMNQALPSVNLNEYRYALPEERVPDRPLDNREDSKLLIYKEGDISECVFSEIVNFLPKQALIVFNNSKVIPARLHFVSPSNATIEVLCLHSVGRTNVKGTDCTQDWKCIVGNLKRWKDNQKLTILLDSCTLSAEIIERNGEENVVRFAWDAQFSFLEILEKIGELPLPPYMHREADESDKKRYQTVYASVSGSVAAPTAGLHFTPKILDQIKEAGVKTGMVTLHVGAGTFKPIKSDEVSKHTMHQEFFEVTKELVVSLLAHDFVLPVGTTSMRTLESLYFLGAQLRRGEKDVHVRQWSGFDEEECSKEESLQALLTYLEKNGEELLVASTSIMIVPGYRFRMCKGLVTNFHQPESTLILLVAAFVGQDWKRIYDFAMLNGFRFLSYGDSSLLLP